MSCCKRAGKLMGENSRRTSCRQLAKLCRAICVVESLEEGIEGQHFGGWGGLKKPSHLICSLVQNCLTATRNLLSPRKKKLVILKLTNFQELKFANF